MRAPALNLTSSKPKPDSKRLQSTPGSNSQPFPGPAVEIPRVASHQLQVPLVTGGSIGYANLDHAASPPCLEAVQHAVTQLLPWYASVHRGAGFPSQVATRIFEQSRQQVRQFVDADARDTVLFTRNTTDAMNLLAACLPRPTAVVVLETEHHAALLPWQGPYVHRVPVPADRIGAVSAVEQALAGCPEGPRLLVVSAASNVTGELLPVTDFVRVARGHGARVAIDAAQITPHYPISIREWDVDYLALSGHKLYAPFGCGALIGRTDWLGAAAPYLKGGGATTAVTRRGDQLEVSWHQGTQRHEAGSPNVVGAHALAIACQTLSQHWYSIRTHEQAMLARLREGLTSIPQLTELRLFPGTTERVGTVSFLIDGYEPGWLAAVLSAEYGIGVRDGAFCAHLATRKLISRAGLNGDGALRASVGLGTTAEHVDRLIAALRRLVSGSGPQWRYAVIDGRWQPTPDRRPLPPLPLADATL